MHGPPESTTEPSTGPTRGPIPPPTHPPLEPPDVARLLDFLKGRDVTCPLCGYNLRDLSRAKCPECRQALVLTVGLDRLRLGWFLTTVTPGIFSGIAAVLLMIPMVLIPLQGGGAAPGFIIATDVFGWVSGLAALVLIARRNRFLRCSIMVQVIAASAAWMIHIAAFALLVVAITS